jgi:hypothetical protein
MSPTVERFFSVLSAVMLLGFSAFFSFAALAPMAPNPACWPLAVVNLLVGSWCLGERQLRSYP